MAPTTAPTPAPPCFVYKKVPSGAVTTITLIDLPFISINGNLDLSMDQAGAEACQGRCEVHTKLQCW